MIEAGFVLAWIVNVLLAAGGGFLWGRQEQLRERLRDTRNLAGLSDLEIRVGQAEAKLRARAAEAPEDPDPMDRTEDIRDKVVRDVTRDLIEKAANEGIQLDPEDARRDADAMVRAAEGR